MLVSPLIYLTWLVMKNVCAFVKKKVQSLWGKLKTHQGIGWLNLMQENYFMLTAYCYGLSILENRSGYFSLICLYLQ